MEHRRVLFVSSDDVAAGLLERQLGTEYEVHSAATDDAAFALLDTDRYACVVVDLRARSTAGGTSTIRLNALTTPVVAIVAPGAETVLTPATVPCVNDEHLMERLVAAVKASCR